MALNPETPIGEPVRIESSASPGFEQWIAQAGGSLAVSTYQAGKVALVGWDGTRVTLLMRQFDKPLGLAVDGSRLALATRYDLTLFSNASVLAGHFLEGSPGRYDALYLPRVTWHTGDLHTHDVVFAKAQGDNLSLGDGSGEKPAKAGTPTKEQVPGGADVLLVNTRFSCLARLTAEFNFAPVWKPKFVSDIVPEDRCHLNGLALRDGRPKYVTALGTTDEPGAWRQNKAAGGVVIDIDTDEVVAGGLSMPHSPRWYGNALWVLNSGTGELLAINPATGEVRVVCACRGTCADCPWSDRTR